MEQNRNPQYRRIEDSDLDVARHEPDVRDWTVSTRDGRALGTVDDLIVDTQAMKVRYLEVDLKDDAAAAGAADDTVYLPVADVDLDTANERVIVRGSGIADLRGHSPANLSSQLGARTAARGSAEARNRITRAEEEVHIGKREVQAGEVRVGKHIDTEHVRESVPIARESVHVERRPIEGDRAAEIRASADEVRVPIMEEEVVVDKRPVAKEELVISKDRVQDHEVVDTEIRKERFDIDDSTAKGRAVDRTDATRRRGGA